MRQLQFLTRWERLSYENQWTSSTLRDAADWLENHADLVEHDSEHYLGLMTRRTTNYTVATAIGVYSAVCTVYPFTMPIRDGRQIARKMRRAARRAHSLARYKAVDEARCFLEKG